MSNRGTITVAKNVQIISSFICGWMLILSSAGCRTPWLSASSDKSKFDAIVVKESERSEPRSRIRNAIPANQRMSMTPPASRTKPRVAESYADADAYEDEDLSVEEEIQAAMDAAPPEDRERLRLTYEALKNQRNQRNLAPASTLEDAATSGNSFSMSDSDDGESGETFDTEPTQEVTIKPLQPRGPEQKRPQAMAAKGNLSDQTTARNGDSAVATPATTNVAAAPQTTANSAVTPASAVSTGNAESNDSGVVSAAIAASAVTNTVDVASPNASSSVSATPPAADYRKLLHEAIAAAKAEQADASKIQSPEQKRNLEVSLRMMNLLVGDLDAAEVPVEGLQPHEQDYFRNVFHALYDAMDPQGNPVLARRMTLVLQSHRQALAHLSAVSNLEVQNVAFCTEVDSYGIMSKFPQYHFRPDQELLLYCELDNFVAEPVKDGFQTQLQGSYEIVDSNGRRVADQLLPMDEHICRNQRRDYFIAYRMYMPQDIKPGRYQLKLTIEDMKGRKFGQSNVDFQVVK